MEVLIGLEYTLVTVKVGSRVRVGTKIRVGTRV